ncbi:MAG: hypothetical protein ACK42I_00320 [Thermomicrobium sp.]
MIPDARCLTPAVLAEQLAVFGEDAIFCVHQAELGLPGALAPGVLLLLGRLKLLHPLTQRIPRCREHGCPLTDRCPYVGDFDGDAGGSSGRRKGWRKFRMTAQSQALIQRPELLAELLPAHPAARWLGQRFAERRDWSCFQLAERWLADALAVVGPVPVPAEKPDTSAAQPDFEGSRRELAACVAILVGLGWLRWGQEDGLTLHLRRPWW